MKTLPLPCKNQLLIFTIKTLMPTLFSLISTPATGQEFLMNTLSTQINKITSARLSLIPPTTLYRADIREKDLWLIGCNYLISNRDEINELLNIINSNIYNNQTGEKINDFRNGILLKNDNGEEFKIFIKEQYGREYVSVLLNGSLIMANGSLPNQIRAFTVGKTNSSPKNCD